MVMVVMVGVAASNGGGNSCYNEDGRCYNDCQDDGN